MVIAQPSLFDSARGAGCRGGPIARRSPAITVPAPAPWRKYGWPHTREPLARTRDPETSHEAAAGYLEDAKAQQAQIHAYLVGVGPRGATAKEIARALGWTMEQVDRRMSEMRDAEMVSTRNGKRYPGGELMPGCLPLERRERCCVHVARCHAGAT